MWSAPLLPCSVILLVISAVSIARIVRCGLATIK